MLVLCQLRIHAPGERQFLGGFGGNRDSNHSLDGIAIQCAKFLADSVRQNRSVTDTYTLCLASLFASASLRQSLRSAHQRF